MRYGPLLVALGGAAGATARYAISSAINARREKAVIVTPKQTPVGTMVVNVLGSFLIGVSFFGLNHRSNLWALLLVTGFCGGFTTFSTAIVESITLARAGHLRLAINSAIVTLAACALAIIGGIAFGYWLANLGSTPYLR